MTCWYQEEIFKLLQVSNTYYMRVFFFLKNVYHKNKKDG
jgi:hypothetical protein